MKLSRVLLLLVIGSLMFQYIPVNHSSSEFTTISDNNDVRYNTEANEYEIEVYSQNDLEKTAETLSWWPNDDKDSTMMQFIITIDDVDIIADLQNISFNVFTVYEELEITFFSLDISPSSLIVKEGNLILITNYSYGSNFPASNYSLELEVFFSDGTIDYYLDENQIILNKYGYKISSELVDFVVDFCQGYETIIPITLRNIGQIDTVVAINLTLMENFPAEEIIYEFDQEPYFELFAGEMIMVNIVMIVEGEGQDFPAHIDLRYNVEYYNDSTDGYFHLDADVMTFETRLLPEYTTPGYILKHLEYGELINTLTEPSDKGEGQLYFLQNDSMSFSLQLFNLGFNDELFTIDILNEIINYQLIFQNFSYSSVQLLNEQNLKVERGASIEIIFELDELEAMENFPFPFTVSSNYPEHNINLKINFAKQPLVNEDLILTSNSSATMFNLSNNDTTDVGVNISQYSELLTFENQWTINCDIEGLIEVTLHPLEQSCSAPNDEQQISINSSMELMIHFNFDQTLPAGNYYLNLTINHDPNVQESNLSHSIMFHLFMPLIEDEQNNTDSNENNSDGNQTDNSQTNGNNSSTNNNTTGTPVDDCADIQCDACPLGMVSDPNGGCCACMEAPETNVDSGNQTGDSTKTATEESNMPTYLIIGLVIAALVAAVVIIRARKSSETPQIVSNKTITQLPMPALPLPGLPIPSAPVVLQEWTDDNGYSWRQMSDRTIMWWNGSDWIPYGKN